MTPTTTPAPAVTAAAPSLPQLLDRVTLARNGYRAGQCPVETLYAAADAYLAALTAYKRRTKRRLAIPSRAYLIRLA